MREEDVGDARHGAQRLLYGRALLLDAVMRAFAVRPMENPARDRVVELLARRHPDSARQRSPAQYPPRGGCHQFGCESAHLLQEMAEILIRHHAVERAAAAMARGKLEVDHRGAAVGCHQPVLRLGEIVVRDAGTAQAAQDPKGVAVPFARRRAADMQRLAFRPEAEQAVGIDRHQLRRAIDPRNGAQRTDLALCQQPRERARPPRRRGDDAADDRRLRCVGHMALVRLGEEIPLQYGF